MAEAFLGEIRMVGFNYAPQGWALCDGQVLSISQNTALFALLGTTYGGNGQTTFALPDLRGRVPVHPGQGPGLSPYVLGQSSGVEAVSLNAAQIPAHSHPVAANSNSGGADSPIGNFPAAITDPNSGASINAFATTANGAMNPGVVGVTGGSQPHTNLQPSLCVNFIIALQGIFPSRS
ncbi:tail fiber protein [Methylomicrobium sp. Wu6]|uniref:phage tail protein n=1 Tax=Methylomicrobium sp. Wu6 TaxID=3107928 RepID=UPI002DD684AF|nr:tail fiber protein [Methylomicrobium sp. Wu6]MEC4750559.1 tail fiber protein [Methylomicrobium sp. Wu6]